MGGYTKPILAWITSALLIIATAESYSFGATNQITNSSNYTPPVVPLKVIPASEIISKIKVGQPVEYDHALIIGELNLKQLDLGTTSFERRKHSAIYGYDPGYNKNLTNILSPISIRNSVIEGNITLDNSIFMNLVSFSDTRFNGTADFRWSIFIKDVYFSSCEFGGEAYFEGSLFNRNAVFTKSLFLGDTDFMESQFNGDADFVRSLFYGGANFPRSNFKGNGYFTGAYFNEDAYFYDAQFCRDAYFFVSLFRDTLDVMFNKTVDFSRAHFYGNAGFYGQFKGNADFSHTIFEQNADFEGSHFAQNTDFRGAHFINNATFYTSEFNGFSYFEGSKFSGPLNLTKTKFDRINIYWPDISFLICDDGPSYLALIKNFRNLEQYEAADDIYYQYRYWKQEQRYWSDISKRFPKNLI